MATGTYNTQRGFVGAILGFLIGGQDDSPTLTSGSGAPTAAEPNGSVYVRTNASHAGLATYVRVGGAWKPTGPTTGTSTGTGSQQTIAHGLGVTPRFVLICPKTADTSPLPIVEGTHTSTNILVTLPNNTAYTWAAFP